MPDISLVEHNLYIAGRRALSVEKDIWESGIRAILRLEYTPGVQWSNQFKVLHIPLEDNDRPGPEFITQGTAFIHAQRRQGHAVLIQDRDGKNLSVMMVLAYLIEYEGLNLPDAFFRVLLRLHGSFPSREAIYGLVQHYHLPYDHDAVSESLFFERLIREAQSQISPIYNGVYLSGITVIRRQESIRKMGIQAVLRLDRINRFAAQWSDAFTVLDLPIPDAQRLSSGTLTTGASFIHLQVKGGKRVLVHCQMGVSRGSTMILAYLVGYCKMNLPEALRLVRSKRPITQPHPLLLESLVTEFGLPYTIEEVNRPYFVDDLLAGTLA